MVHKVPRLVVAFAAVLAFSAHAAFATPVLFKTNKVSCNLYVDGDLVGSIQIDGILKSQLASGEHVVECKSTFLINDRPVPASSSQMLTVSGDDQRVVTLAPARIRASDIARAAGANFQLSVFFDRRAPGYGSAVMVLGNSKGEAGCYWNEVAQAMGESGGPYPIMLGQGVRTCENSTATYFPIAPSGKYGVHSQDIYLTSRDGGIYRISSD